MKIVVCLKQILDPELPPSLFEIDDDGKQAKIGKHPLVISPYDENALEMALQLKDSSGEVYVIALAYGSKGVEEALRKALGVLADEAVLILKKDDSIEHTYETARVLAAAIKKIDSVDLVICGRQAGDWDAGQAPLLIAEELGIPAVSFVHKIDMGDDGLTLTRHADAGTEVFASKPPVVVSVTNDDKNLLRIAKVKDVLKAHRKPVEFLTVLDLEPADDPELLAYSELNRLFIPVVDNVCEIIQGDEPKDKVTTLLRKLRDQKTL
jgi:electron transfer flavoprotein beta subunit